MFIYLLQNAAVCKNNVEILTGEIKKVVETFTLKQSQHYCVTIDDFSDFKLTNNDAVGVAVGGNST